MKNKPNRLLRGLKPAFQLFMAFVFFSAQMQYAHATIDNDARAAGIFNGAAIISQISSQAVPVIPAAPDLDVIKTGILNDDDGTPGLSAGDTISYTVEVSNPGNVTLTGITVNDPLVALTFQSGDLDNDFRLDTNETFIFTGTYTITSFDLATNGGGDGDIDNTVTADSNETPPEMATQQTPIDPNVSILVEKTGTLNDDDGITGVTAGDTIDYVITVNNNGVTDLTNIVLTDTLVQGTSSTPLVPVLDPASDLNSDNQINSGETFVYNLTYVLTQQNIDDGNDLVNTVSVTTDEIGPREASDTQLIPGAINSFTMTKIATLVDGDGDNLGDAGETINYTFRFTNTGNRILTNLAVTDPLPGLSAIICSNDVDNDGDIDLLQLGQTLDCTASVVIQSSDAAAGSVDNTATPTATQSDDVTPVLEDDTANDNSTSTPVDQIFDLDVTKDGTLNDDDGILGVSAGDTIDYVVTVTNPGTVPLTNIVVNDPLVTLTFQSGDTNGDNILDMGEVFIYTGTYVLTALDISTNGGGDGDIDNTVTASSDQTGTETASHEESIVSGVSIDVEKVGVLNDDDGTPGLSAGDTIDYTITVENDGTSDLTNPVLADTLTQNGVNTALVPVFDSGDLNSDGIINPGESFIFLATYTLTLANVNDGSNIVNTVTVTTDQIGPESDTDTQVLGAVVNSFTMTKIANLVDGDGDNLGDTGEDINYTFRFTNTGTGSLTNLRVSDPLPGLTTILCSNDGDNDGDIDLLAPGATADCAAALTIQTSDVANGSVDNTATTSATTADGTTPVVEDDTANDNSTTTPTDTVISLDVNKTVASAVEILPNVVEIEYLLELTNTGTLPLTNLTLEDDLTAAVRAPAQILGTGSVTIFSGFIGTGTSNPSYNGVGNNQLFSGDVQLAAGATGQVRIQLQIDRRSQALSTENVALVTSTELLGPTPSDDPNDPNGPDDPTVFDKPDDDDDGSPDTDEPPTTDRDGDGIPDSEDFDPTGYFYCQEDGRILAGGLITVVNVFTGGAQTGIGSSNDITILQDGSNGFYQFYVTAPGTYRLVPTLPAGGIASTDRLSSGVLDVTSLLPANPGVLGAGEVGNTGILNDFTAAANPFFTEFVINTGDPTVFNNNLPLALCSTPEITANKQVATAPAIQADGTSNLTYRVSVENTGFTRVDNVSLRDDLNATFGAGNFTVVNTTLENAPAGFAANASTTFNGAGNTNLLTIGGNLEAGELASVLIELNVNVPAGNFTNTVVAGGDNPLTGVPLNDVNASVVVAIDTAPSTGIIATKTTPIDAAPLGGIVPYTITFENTSGIAANNIELVDLLPFGFSYIQQSAILNGAAVEPTISGFQLVWPNQDLAPGARTTITLSLAVGAATTGTEFVNTAFARNPVDGSDLSNRATATIKLEIESVFQCSHIIGRVFDDLDADGYYDPGEPGLPGARVVSVNGLLITTDEFGRYHVTCDIIPADRIGSNYILKLDRRTLPTGYTVTSENPRVVRVTRGKLAKINFAAARLRTINVVLEDTSFESASTNLTRSALTDIGRVLPLLEEERSVLKLNYETQGQKTQLQRSRIESVKALINKAWKARKRPHRLEVEADVK